MLFFNLHWSLIFIAYDYKLYMSVHVWKDVTKNRPKTNKQIPDNFEFDEQIIFVYQGMCNSPSISWFY